MLIGILHAIKLVLTCYHLYFERIMLAICIHTIGHIKPLLLKNVSFI